jgi:hypothetical protein
MWFVAWAIRRRGELDHQLDVTAKTIRWVVVALFLGLPVQAPQLVTSPNIRLSLGTIGVAFLVWPNFAYYLTRVLRRWKVLRRADHVPNQATSNE